LTIATGVGHPAPVSGSHSATAACLAGLRAFGDATIKGSSILDACLDRLSASDFYCIADTLDSRPGKTQWQTINSSNMHFLFIKPSAANHLDLFQSTFINLTAQQKSNQACVPSYVTSHYDPVSSKHSTNRSRTIA